MASIDDLSIEEKASLLAGSGFWTTTGIPERGIPQIMLTDGPHGVRKQSGAADHLGLNASVPATCFPAECLSACSFDPDLMFEVGRAIGEECLDEDIAVVLGPGLNIKRSPLCGRGFEYFSEDPLLTGKMGAAMVRGVQSMGVGASVKHFAANSQEKARMVSNSLVDDRALNEIYLRPFEIATREAAPATVMVSYNKLNGTYCSQSSYLMEEKLRGQWGFEGACITDWGALDESVPAVRAGLDLTMPGPREDHAAEVAHAVSSGDLDASALDRAASKVLDLVEMRTSAKASDAGTRHDVSRHLDVARRMAEASAVLLHNGGALPLKRGRKVALLGAFAKYPRFQGAGSSRINPIDLDCTLDSMRELGVDLECSGGYDATTGSATEEMLQMAEETASRCDVSVVLAGLPAGFESEGFDRAGMGMPQGHVDLLERVCLASRETVVVLFGGGPIELPWIANANDDDTWGASRAPAPNAVLAMYLPGCQGGMALARLLTGEACPSGKLAETWPVRLTDTALGAGFPDPDLQVRYSERIFVGSRFFDASGTVPAYPFGHGLSYTSFQISDASIESVSDGYDVTAWVTNTGEREGAEVLQVYVGEPDATEFMPRRWLAGFTKVLVGVGEKVQALVHLDRMAFSHWDPIEKSWRADDGEYEVSIGTSSRDLHIVLKLKIGEDAPFETRPRREVGDEERAELAAYYDVRPDGFDDESFMAVYRAKLPPARRTLPFDRNSTLHDLKQTFVGRRVRKIIHRKASAVAAPEEDVARIMVESLEDMPLRSLQMGGVSMSKIDGIVDILNHRFLRGIRKLCS